MSYDAVENEKIGALNLLRAISAPIRLPTAQWLFSDVLGVIDIIGRDIVHALKADGHITVDNGGWIRLT